MNRELASAPVAAQRPRKRRFIMPAILFLAIVAAFLTVPVAERLDVDLQTLMNVKMIAMPVVELSLVLLLVWFLAFSGFRWYTRILGLVLLLLLVGGSAAAIRKVEFTGDMMPVFILRWQPDLEAEAEHYLAQPQTDVGLPPITLSIDPVNDFPRYRGVNADGVLSLLTLGTDWQAHSPKVVWKHPCGGGYSGFAVAGNVAITLEQRHEKEAVVCYDRAKGKQRWVYDYPDLFHRVEPMGGDGPRATPTINYGEVFSVGANGRLVCLDEANGKEKWFADIIKDAGAKNAEWGMSGSPLVIDELVIVNPGIDKDNNIEKALAAYNRETGKPVWQKGAHPAGYSSPQLAKLAGVVQILLFDGDGLAGYDPNSGDELWRHEWKTSWGMNIIQPILLDDDRIFLASNPTGCAVVQVRRNGKSFTVEEVWKNRKLGMGFSNPVAANGYFYGLADGTLVCIDQETGKSRWKGENFGSGQLLLAGDVLVVTGEQGELALVAAKPDGFHELARMQALTGKTWNTPALAGNQLFLRNHREMMCLALPLAKK